MPERTSPEPAPADDEALAHMGQASRESYENEIEELKAQLAAKQRARRWWPSMTQVILGAGALAIFAIVGTYFFLNRDTIKAPPAKIAVKDDDSKPRDRGPAISRPDPAPAPTPTPVVLADWDDLNLNARHKRITNACGAKAKWGEVDLEYIAEALRDYSKESAEQAIKTCDVTELVKKAEALAKAAPATDPPKDEAAASSTRNTELETLLGEYARSRR